MTEPPGRPLRIDPDAESASDDEPAFVARPPGAPVYHSFPILDDVEVGGFKLGMIDDWEAEPTTYGDAFLVAPDGSAAVLTGRSWRSDGANKSWDSSRVVGACGTSRFHTRWTRARTHVGTSPTSYPICVQSGRHGSPTARHRDSFAGSAAEYCATESTRIDAAALPSRVPRGIAFLRRRAHVHPQCPMFPTVED